MGGERGQRDTAVHRSSEAWLTKVMFSERSLAGLDRFKEKIE